MSQSKLRTKYEAVGFVEALIAIAVAGIASVVLMTIAANTVAQVIRNETADKMTEIAIEGSALSKKIADNHNNDSSVNLFPKITESVNSCFAFDGSTNEPKFIKNGEVFESVCNYDSGERDQCKSAAMQEDEDFFRIFCFTPESDSARDLVVGKVVVGLIDCNSIVANSKCELSDYEYYTAVKVVQRD